jgi:hypothetical protein
VTRSKTEARDREIERQPRNCIRVEGCAGGHDSSRTVVDRQSGHGCRHQPTNKAYAEHFKREGRRPIMLAQGTRSRWKG